MIEARSLSLGRVGEQAWQQLSNHYQLAATHGCTLVVADSREVRDEIRRRLERKAGACTRLPPARDVLEAIHALAATAPPEHPPLVWIEADDGDAEHAWGQALLVLNRGRDLVWDRGPVYVVLAGPRSLHQQLRRGAPDLSSTIKVVPVDAALEVLATPTQPLSWLHLSDLHIGSRDWQQDIVLDALLRDLPGLLGRAERTPQLLFVTGDVARRGQAHEYEAAAEFFAALARVTGIPREHTFMVAGNHDVDRSAITKAVAHSKRLLLEEVGEDEAKLRGVLDEILGDPSERRRFGVRLAHWCAFTKRMLGDARCVQIDELWRTDIVTLAGVDVGVASLCSTWLAGEADDAKGGIVLGEIQVSEASKALREGGAQLRIALLHHPTTWLHDAECSTIEALLRREFDVVLSGHQHRSKAGTFVQGRRDTVEIAAGAAYAGIGQDRHHGFHVATLDASAGQLEVDAFTYTHRSGGHWHIDAGVDRDAPQGRLCVPLRLARLGAAPATDPDDAWVGRVRLVAARVHGAARAFVSVPGPHARTSLRDTFVPLDVRERRALGEAKHSSEQLGERWLAEHAHVVVLGEPGSGKSTLCQQLVVAAAEREGGPAPILVTVRDWVTEGAREGLLELARRHVAQHLSIRGDIEQLERLARAGKLLLILDGIDEASLAARKRLRDRLTAFVTEFSRVGVIATSRLVGYDDAPLGPEFEHVEILPFDDARLREFIARWYVAAEPHASERKSATLWAAMQADSRVRALAGNPLLASAIALVHAQRAELPRSRAKLYESLVELLIVTWPATQGRALGELDGYAQLPMLEALALALQEQRSSLDGVVLITHDELVQRLEALLAEHRYDLDLGRRRSLARAWAQWLVRDSGLLQEQQHERLGFIHLSVLEYLAGRALLERSAHEGDAGLRRVVMEHLDESSWTQTLTLMVACRAEDRVFCEALLHDLVALNHWDASTLALGLLAENIHVTPTFVDDVMTCAIDHVLGGDQGEWGVSAGHVERILHASNRHAVRLSDWFEHFVKEADGPKLAAGLVLAPFRASLRDTLARRLPDHVDLSTTMRLHAPGQWGAWARAAAPTGMRLRWIVETPLVNVAWQAMANAADPIIGSSRPWEWIAGLFARGAWFAGQAVRHAAVIRAQRWSRERLTLTAMACPAWISRDHESSTSERGDHWLDLYDGASVSIVGHVAAWQSFQGDERKSLRDAMIGLSMYLGAWPPLPGFHGEFVRDQPKEAFRRILDKRLKPPRPSSLPSALEPLSGVARATVPTTSSPIPSLSDCTDMSSIGGLTIALLTQSALDAFVYLRASSNMATMAAQHRWILTYLPPLIAHADAQGRLSPHQQALYLALGLAQYQTTWTWPAGPHWHAWFTAPAPTHWLAAYVWHLCWAVGEPEQPDHLARAVACLDRADEPELVAILREYPSRPTPPEVLALFDGRGGAGSMS